jgi:Transglutaminase-like superfamily
LKDWAATSAWLSGFSDPAAAVTDAIRAKAADLTAGTKTEAEKIGAIGRFAQKTNYVEVAMNIERGGGYTPHAASEVLSRNYGDCKDKAGLTRALLAAIGIKSYAISIYSGDRQFVRPEWPSSLQFNHAIVAIAVSPDTKFPAVLEDPRLGRLLIFDPTSAATPLGDLPEYEQNSYALVEAGPNGELLRMPLSAPETNRVESVSTAQLALDGQLSAHVERRYLGQSARPLRSRLQRHDRDELRKAFEESLARRLGGMKLERIEPLDRFESNELQLNMDIQVRQFGRFMQEKMLMVSPGALIPESGYAFPAKPRKWPVRLSASLHKDSVEIALPPEFKVDEMPDPIKIETAYGAYVAEWKVKGNQLSFKQSLEVKETTAPASEYGKIRDFFERVNSGQHSAVVLLKQ